MRRIAWAILVACVLTASGLLDPARSEDVYTEKPGDDGRCLGAPQVSNNVIVEMCSRVIASAKARGRRPGELARFFFCRGTALRGLGRLDEALADMNSAIATDPKYDAGYYGMGEVYLAQKQFQKALDVFDDPHVWIQNVKVRGRAEALEGLGRVQEAIAEWKRLEGIDSSMKYQVNEALIRLGDRPPPAAAPAAKDQSPGTAPPTSPSPPSGGGGGGFLIPPEFL